VNKRTLDNMELPVMMFDNSVIFESNDGFDNPNYNLARVSFFSLNIDINGFYLLLV